MIEGLPLVAILLSVIVISWVRTICYLVRRLFRRPPDSSTPCRRPGRWTAGLQLGNLLFSVVALVAFWYSYFIEPYRAEVVTETLESEKLSRHLPPLRLVHISDLHSDPRVRLEAELPDIISALAPDIILFTGDAINSREGLSTFQECMASLVGIAPVFAVKGNWDVWWFRDVNLYGDGGVDLLEGRSHPVTLRGQKIWLTGSSVEDERSLERALRTVPAGDFSVALHHFPEAVDMAQAGGADLLLSGDTHGGGQVRLPLLGEMIRIKRFGPFDRYYTAGLHRLGSTALYVNRGIGMEGNHAPRIRFGCRPEVTLILLRGTGDHHPAPVSAPAPHSGDRAGAPYQEKTE